jgi:hypothetical protein
MKRVERERIDCLVFILATVALPIDGNPLQSGTQLVLRAASSSIYYKISMIYTCLDIIFLDQIEGGSIVIAVYIYMVKRPFKTVWALMR